MKTLYVSDLDGTLLNSNASLSDFTINTVNRLIDKGLNFTLATARSISSAKGLIEGLNLKIPAVMMNGVFVTDIKSKLAVHVNYINPDSAMRITEIFELCYRPPFIYYYNNDLDVEYKTTKSEYEADFVTVRKKRYRRFEQVDNYTMAENIVYINAIDLPEVLMPIKEALDSMDDIKYSFYPDSYSEHLYFLEVYSGKSGKWNGIEYLKKAYGFEKVVAFGDNLNDLDMLINADTALVVKNGHENAKAAADIIIDTNDNDGVCKYLLETWNK